MNNKKVILIDILSVPICLLIASIFLEVKVVFGILVILSLAMPFIVDKIIEKLYLHKASEYEDIEENKELSVLEKLNLDAGIPNDQALINDMILRGEIIYCPNCNKQLGSTIKVCPWCEIDIEKANKETIEKRKAKEREELEREQLAKEIKKERLKNEYESKRQQLFKEAEKWEHYNLKLVSKERLSNDDIEYYIEEAKEEKRRANERKKSSDELIKIQQQMQEEKDKYSKSFTDYDFEYYCAELLKENGYKNVKVTKKSGDFGADILAEKSGKKYAVQCKLYSNPASTNDIYEVLGGKAYYNCDIAIVIATSGYTNPARELANKANVILWDKNDLKKLES